RDERKIVVEQFTDANVLKSNYTHALINVMRGLEIRSKRAINQCRSERWQWHDRPPLRIGDRIAEEVEEGGLEEGVELGECFAAFGAQRIRRIQYPRNPLLLRQRREGDFELLDFRER